MLELGENVARNKKSSLFCPYIMEKKDFSTLISGANVINYQIIQIV
jgi:hypothetical protein